MIRWIYFTINKKIIRLFVAFERLFVYRSETCVYRPLLWLTECLKLINYMFRSNVIRLLKFWLINRVDFDFSGVLTWEIIQLINISDLAKFIRLNNWLNTFLEHMCLIRENTNNKTASTIRKKTKHRRRFFTCTVFLDQTF